MVSIVSNCQNIVGAEPLLNLQIPLLELRSFRPRVGEGEVWWRHDRARTAIERAQERGIVPARATENVAGLIRGDKSPRARQRGAYNERIELRRVLSKVIRNGAREDIVEDADSPANHEVGREHIR